MVQTLTLSHRAILATVPVLVVFSAGLPASTSAAAPGQNDRPNVAIIFTPHASYRAAAQALAEALTAKNLAPLLLELPVEAGGNPAPAAPNPDAGSGPATAPADTADGDVPPAHRPSPADMSAILDKISSARPAAFVALGETALAWTVRHAEKTPVVYSMIANGLDLSLPQVAGQKTRILGMAMDPSPEDQLNWIAKTNPHARRIGILHSPRSRKTAQALVKVAQSTPIKLMAIPASKDNFPQAINDMGTQDCDGVLMIADAQVYNQPTVQRLLLWGLRQRASVWTFSENVVKAGALAGLYSDPESRAQATTDLVGEVISGKGGDSSSLRYPRNLRKAVNERTAAMIGVSFSEQLLESGVTLFGRDK